MKRFFLIPLTMILLAGMVLGGCAQQAPAPATTPSPTSKPAPSPTVAPSPAPSPAPITTPSPTAKPAPTTAPAKVYNLKFSYHTPPQASLVGAYLKPWTEAIEKATGGQVKITHYPGETLVKAKDQYDALVSKLSDIALVDTSETPGRFPQTEFDTLPYIFVDGSSAAKTYWDILQKYCVNSELKEIQLLAVAVIASSNYAGNKSAQNVSDFKGMRVRSAGRTESWTVGALGATPIEIATSDLSTSLERGLIDGVFISWSAILSFGIKDVTKYRTECDMYYRVFPIIMNKQVWNSLPADIQKAIMDASGQANSATYSVENVKLGLGAKNAIAGSDKATGKPPIYTLTAEQLTAWKAAVLPVWDKWAADLNGKGLPGKAIIDDIKTFNQKYTAK